MSPLKFWIGIVFICTSLMLECTVCKHNFLFNECKMLNGYLRKIKPCKTKLNCSFFSIIHLIFLKNAFKFHSIS